MNGYVSVEGGNTLKTKGKAKCNTCLVHKAGLAAAVLFSLILVRPVAAGEDGIDWYAAIEAGSHSNVPLSVTPADDIYLVYYGGLSYSTEASTRRLETGLKGRLTDYIDFNNFDNGELQLFCNFDVDTARGDVGGSVKFASLREISGQDLLILNRNRRNRTQFDADYKTILSRTSLGIGADVDYLNYTSTSLDNLDYLGTGVNLTIGRNSAKWDLGFRYGHGKVDYYDTLREDYSKDFFGLGVEYEAGSHLAIGGHLGYSMADSPSYESQALAGRIKATYSASEGRTLLMFSFSQDFLPSSIGNFSNSMKVEVSGRRLFNETLKGELALTHEASEYNNGYQVDRTQIWGGVSAELGRRSTAYVKVAHVMYGEQGGATIPGDYTVVTIGFKYGL